jgi:hypothetical protein
MKPAHYVHASAFALDDAAILISGPSKAGKSTLAEALIAHAQRLGHHAEWIGDDRVGLFDEAGTLLVRPHPAIAGLIERRGTGIIAVPFQPQAAARLEIALTGPIGEAPSLSRIERLPGLSLPLLVVQPRPAAERPNFELARKPSVQPISLLPAGARDSTGWVAIGLRGSALWHAGRGCAQSGP